MFKSTLEYKNHKKRFQAGSFPSKLRKKKSKKSKILDSIEGSSGNTPIELEITDGNNFPREYANVPSGYCFRLTAYEMTNIILLIFNSIVNTLPLV